MKKQYTIVPAEPGLRVAGPYDPLPMVVAWRIEDGFFPVPVFFGREHTDAVLEVVFPDGNVVNRYGDANSSLKDWRIHHLLREARREKLTEMPTQEWIDDRCDGVTVADVERSMTVQLLRTLVDMAAEELPTEMPTEEWVAERSDTVTLADIEPLMKRRLIQGLRKRAAEDGLTEMPDQAWIDERCSGVTVADLERKKTPAVE